MTSLRRCFLVCFCWYLVQEIQSLNGDLGEHDIQKRQASSIISINFNERDYETDENTGFAEVTLRIEGATTQPLTIHLTPLNISIIRGGYRPDFISALPPEDPTRPRTAISGVDFPTEEINYELPVSTATTRFIDIKVPIIDDKIDELQQTFAVELSVSGPLVVDTSFRNFTLIEINDDDDIFLAWEFSSYTFEETLQKRVTIIKAENTTTELTLNFVVQAVLPNVSQPANVFADYTFGPRRTSIEETITPKEQAKDISVLIIPEQTFEGDEVFQLRLSNALDGLPFSTNVNGVVRDLTTVTIIDKIQVGFTQTAINVTEGETNVKICVEENGPRTGLEQVIAIGKAVFLGILTVNGSAGEDDYTKVGKVDDNVVVLVNQKPINESHCFLVNITDDDIVEDIEQFTVTLHVAVNDQILLNSVTIQPDTVVITIIDDDDDTVPIIVNDTVIGDPLLTVPINVINLESEGFTSNLSLCFEIHGQNDRYFNFVSDECVSVNAHYTAVDIFNIIDAIAVKAVDERGECRNILVSMTPDGHKTNLDGVELSSNIAMDGISIRMYSSRVRIMVSNCDDQQLVMWVLCVDQTLQGFDKNNVLVRMDARMIKFVIARGFNLKETSHGILGQFWNVPVSVQRYNRSESIPSANSYYNVTIMHPNSSPRSFLGFLWSVAWEYSTTGERKPCLYAGTKNAGRTSEIAELTGSVIEGFYLDYATDQAFGTNFKYTQFAGTCPTLTV